MKSLRLLSVLLSIFILSCNSESRKIKINISFSDSISERSIDGRLLLIFADNDKSEPRFQVSEGLNAQPIFGINVEDLKANTSAAFTEDVFGFPYESLSELNPGEYYVQAVLHVYETFNLSTGHTVKLPMDNGEGQHWNTSPGNLYSTPYKLTVTDNGVENFGIVLDNVIPEIEPPVDTKWIKHIRMKSKLLSEFWGKDMYLGAHILLPKGFEEHPEAKYPLMVFQGHFPSDFGGFRTTPPDANLKPTSFQSSLSQ